MLLSKNIVKLDDVLSEELSAQCMTFSKKWSVFASAFTHGPTSNTCCEQHTLLPSKSYDDAVCNAEATLLHDRLESTLRDIFERRIVPLLPDLPLRARSIRFPRFVLRKMLGPTTSHSDQVRVVKHNGCHYAFFGTIICTLNDNNDTIVFPNHNLEVPLTRGSVLFFPTFWDYVHRTTFDASANRYSIVTFTMEPTHYTSD